MNASDLPHSVIYHPDGSFYVEGENPNTKHPWEMFPNFEAAYRAGMAHQRKVNEQRTVERRSGGRRTRST